MRLIFCYLFILFALIIGISSVSRLTVKAYLPFDIITGENEKILAETDYENIQAGNEIFNIDNIPVSSLFEAEYILDSKNIGQTVNLSILTDNNNSKDISIVLVPYYKNNLFILITSIVGLLYWLTGAYVIKARPEDRSAKILCLTLVTFSVAILTSPGFYGSGDDFIGYADRLSHTLSYIFGSVFFIHFTLSFPNKLFRKQNILLSALYVFAVLFSLIIAYVQINSLIELNIELIKQYYDLWKLAELFLAISLLSSVIILPLKYRRKISRNEKAQIEWIYWGIALSVSPFLLFWLVPGIFGLPYLVDEEILLLFLILIPISFAIAVVKFRLFDIDVVIKRSIIYSILIALIITLYLGLIYFFGKIGSNYFEEDALLFNILTAVTIALLFSPLRSKVRHFVNSVFFREKYNFDEAVSQLTAGIKECKTLNLLGNFLTEEINKFIPVKSIAIVVKSPGSERLRILNQHNFDQLSKYISALRINKLNSKFKLPFALKGKIDNSIIYDDSLELVFKRWEINLVIPFLLDSNDIVGAIVLGEKISGLNYSIFDIELLNPIASSAALAVKRLELQEQLIIEEIEKAKLKELSELKSYFVASVSHDLKTPLSSIKIFSELLRNDKISHDKSNEYLEIIDGETDRLARMINNVLDFSRIEKNLKTYVFEKTDLNKIVNNVMQVMSYELLMKKFEVEKDLCEGSLFIKGDNDALNSMLANLISNAVKYSGKQKYIKVNTNVKDNLVEVIIEDKGTGISDENLKEIFNPYFRESSTELKKIKGAGLGLSIVKNIVDSHKGQIEVFSELGKGTKFKINFPLYETEKSNTIS